MNPSLIQNISKYHKDYAAKYLKKRLKNKNNYLQTKKQGLFFIFNYCFYQGRLDKTSEKFQHIAENIVDKYFSKHKNYLNEHLKRIKTKNELELNYKDLLSKLKKGRLNKAGDRLMVCSLINFIQSRQEKNIVAFLIEKIKSNNIKKAYQDLDDIWSIGNKIASFILRDIIYIYELEDFLDPIDYKYVCPIDTWVHQVSKKISLVSNEKLGNEKEQIQEAKEISNKCLEAGVSPIHYNQAAWYIGSNSLDIVLQILSKS